MYTDTFLFNTPHKTNQRIKTGGRQQLLNPLVITVTYEMIDETPTFLLREVLKELPVGSC